MTCTAGGSLGRASISDPMSDPIGWALFDRTDPTRVIARSDTPVFAPERDWERAGQVPNVVFVEGLVREGRRWLFYYGGADKHVGVAEAVIDKRRPRP